MERSPETPSSAGDAEITFLITDIEDSAGLWERDPVGMRSALAEHDRLLRQQIEAHGGTVVKTLGDGSLATFPDPTSAVQAAVTAMLAIRGTGPLGAGGAREVGDTRIRVRAAVHTGPAEQRDGDYFGPTLNLLSRILEAAQGGRVLLSSVAAERLQPGAVEGKLLDQGQHRLRGLSNPERLFQVVHPEIPCETTPPRTLKPLQSNLPAQVSSFIGRGKETETLKRQLNSYRLVTVTGAGGTGKTRLAIRVAEELHPELEHGAWFVELGPLADPAFIPAAIAAALRVRERASEPLVETLMEFVRERSLLLVMDNCEHLVDGVAPLVRRLLAAGPGLRVLATSREPLELPGERLHNLDPLGLPQQKRLPPVPQLLEYDAISLFVDRSRLRQEDFELTDENAPAVVEICRRLDGLPLAIELAAARMRHLPVEQIALRLNDALSLLSSRMRAVEPRQQTLRALIDWSYELLTAPERVLMRRLSIFAGGFTREAAEAVCAGDAPDGSVEPEEVEELLHRLCDRSLVVRDASGTDDPGPESRYSLLETVRQYARSRLDETGETAACAARHGEWFLALVQQTDPGISALERQDSLDRLDAEHDNLRAALDWGVQATGTPAAERAFQMAVGLWRFWWMRGHLSQGRMWLERVLALPDAVSLRLRARANTGAGSLAWAQGDYDSAQQHHEASLALWSELEDAPGVASATNNMAMVPFAQGDLQHAHDLFAKTAAAYRTLDAPLRLAQALCNMGSTATLLGEHAAARAALDESLALFRQVGDRLGTASAAFQQALLAQAEGDTPRAAELHQHALDIRLEFTDLLGISSSLEAIAHLLAQNGDDARAARYLGAADSHRNEAGAFLHPFERVLHEELTDHLRARLGEERFTRLFAEGAEQPLAETLAR